MSPSKVCPQCSASYDGELKFCPRDGTALRLPAAGDALVGQIVADRYHVLEKLGEGGMGQVYLAEHVKMGRRSAIKVIRASMVADPDAMGRFNREASNASRISHPNVAAIYDFGETSDGLIYLAMEYVDGEPLSQLVAREGALPPRRAVAIAMQVASALDAAHELGIVHRDLKPDNIMITRTRDGNDLVKVVDFGIAKTTDGHGAQKVTRTGLVIGTPEYMSPEQLTGDRLDGRSDVYTLGLVVFHMLTGTLPFLSDSAQETLVARLTERPMTLAEALPRRTWPAGLQAALDRALERKAAARYARAGEMAVALAAAVQQTPGAPTGAAGRGATVILGGTAELPETIVRRPATTANTTPGRRRSRFAVVLMGILLLAVTGVGAATIVLRGGRLSEAEAAATEVLRTEPLTPQALSASQERAGSGDASRRSSGSPTRLAAAPPDPVEPRTGGSRRDAGGDESRPLARPASPSSLPQQETDASPVAESDGLSEVTSASDLLQRAVELGEAELVERAQRRILRALPRLRNRSDSVRAMYHVAEALIALGQEERACVLLRDIKDDPGQFRRATRVHYDRYCR